MEIPAGGGWVGMRGGLRRRPAGAEQGMYFAARSQPIQTARVSVGQPAGDGAAVERRHGAAVQHPERSNRVECDGVAVAVAVFAEKCHRRRTALASQGIADTGRRPVIRMCWCGPADGTENWEQRRRQPVVVRPAAFSSIRRAVR
jgi:hypothetical protein